MQSITLGHHLTMSHEETRDTAVVLTQYMQHLPVETEKKEPHLEKLKSEGGGSVDQPCSSHLLFLIDGGSPHRKQTLPLFQDHQLAPQLLRLDLKWQDPWASSLAQW